MSKYEIELQYYRAQNEADLFNFNNEQFRITVHWMSITNPESTNPKYACNFVVLLLFCCL